ncbi:MAG: fumarylacetoacetate hydrolase [Acidobacteria bacterium]|jgi:2-keto-4-pentenoate hydratase/2-oxohepta-3-ene-1,7-dioic acid hydratase in catechol pathway|nr:fumarylacetoacetate hydrolase [Acidobacteriota bacterium]MCH2277775.1 fumarylacetoacetate hydrolase family protein [Vicinamibacterales bacterium]|tara:strand:- start:1000 stop:1833 length:834 start_codon:yes stop_codon:yes gene_type:complete
MKGFIASAVVSVVFCATSLSAQGVTKYVRYAYNGTDSYGVLKGNAIHELRGDIFETVELTGRTVALANVKLLIPVQPSKIIAVGFNYRSHLGDREPALYPGLFAKYPTSLIATGEEIVFPPGAHNVHYEGEMVLVIGRRARHVSREAALDYVFGVTAGNDVSERDWQSGDLQWFRAKASDTFGPLGPAVVRGLNPDDLLLQTRVNGEVRQSQRTSDLFFDSSDIISYVTQFVTLEPGDVIYTGTPGATQAMQPGDVVEIELEGVGILRNTIADADTP